MERQSVRSNDQLADFLTKPLSTIGLYDWGTSS